MGIIFRVTRNVYSSFGRTGPVRDKSKTSKRYAKDAASNSQCTRICTVLYDFRLPSHRTELSGTFMSVSASEVVSARTIMSAMTAPLDHKFASLRQEVPVRAPTMAVAAARTRFIHPLFSLTGENAKHWVFTMKSLPGFVVDETKEIKVRKNDRLILGKDLCHAASNGTKLFKNWWSLASVQAFVRELDDDIRGGMESQPTSIAVFDEVKTGLNDERGTWIHPRLVTQLAAWISPKFAVKAGSWVDRILAGDITMMEVVRDAHDAVHGTTTTVAINTVCESRKRPNYVVPDRTLPPSMRVIAKDTQHMLGDFVDSAVTHKDDVGKIMMFLGDKACEAATGQNAGALKRLNGVKNGSARDLMNEEQLENVDYFMRKVMRRAIAAGDGRDFHEIAVSVKRDMATFVAPPSGPTPMEVVKKNKEDMRKDLLLTRPLNLERFYRRVPKLDSTIKGVRDLSGP
eukprot:jgi/Mesvir1/18876/Mv26050-RA.1